MKAFEEDRTMIERQQRIWDLTPPSSRKLFLPQDKALHPMRQIVQRQLDREATRV